MAPAPSEDVSTLGSKAHSAAPVEYFESDYETDCTPLYKALENAIVQEEEDFDHISVYLETGNWPANTAPVIDTGTNSSSKIAAPSADIQARTWVTRFSSTSSNKNKKRVEWSQLPLHLAIVGGAPSNIIGNLVKLYPQALRCTDDQQMLPLHLALRHGADDEIVAYLLMQFPEAANAKGKSGRLPVDCALRARDKLRGIIIETFVEKTKSKLQLQHLKEKTELSVAIDEKKIQLEKVTQELASKTLALNELFKVHTTTTNNLELLKGTQTKTQEDLQIQISELAKEKAEVEAMAQQTIEKLASEKLTDAIELQRKIDSLAAEKRVAEEAVVHAKDEESSTRQLLDTVEAGVAKSVTMDDWNELKQEVDTLQAYRLTKSKTQTKDNIESLKGEIQKTIEDSKSEAKEIKSELKTLQKSVTKLEKVESSANSSEEVLKLQSEVETLRAELRERNEASKMKIDIAALKRGLESELKKKEGKTEDEMKSIHDMVSKSGPSKIETKTNAELTALKTELESISLHLKETELARKTNVEALALEVSLDNAIREADPKTERELSAMKPAVENLRKYVSNINSKDELVSAAKDVEVLKDLLRKKLARSKVYNETSSLHESINNELSKVVGKAQEKELIHMRDVLAGMTEVHIENQDSEDLNKFSQELGAMKKHFRQIEQANKTQQELDALKKTVEEELLRSTENAKKDLLEMKKAVDAVNMEQKESKQVKESLAIEIQRASGKSEADLLALKKKVESINLKDLESKNKDEWDSIRSDLEIMKIDLKQKQEAKLEDTEKELASVKAAIAQINVEQEILTNTKFDELRKEMVALRQDLTPPPASEKKAKNGGLMKLIASRFRRAPTRSEISSVSRVAATDGDVATICPPSVTLKQKQVESIQSTLEDSDDEDGLPPAVQKVLSMEGENSKIQTFANSRQKEVTLALFQSFSREAAAEEERQAKVDAAAVSAMPTFNKAKGPIKMPPSAMRKVRSMDPRIKNVTIDPADIVRSWSKTYVQQSGEVEVESISESEERSETATTRV